MLNKQSACVWLRSVLSSLTGKTLTGVNMKLTKTGKPLLLAVGVLLAFVVWQTDSSKKCVIAENTPCTESQQSWSSWLSGDSRSAQFHFVDFLELVTRMLPSSNYKK